MDDKTRESLKQFSILNYSECKDYNTKQWAMALSWNINEYTELTHLDLGYLRLMYKRAELPEDKEDISSIMNDIMNWIYNKVPITPIFKDSVYSTKLEDKKYYIEMAINLSFTDDILSKRFLSIIREARKARSITPSISSLKKAGKAYTESEMASWHRHGVLPFIDLTIWLKENNMKLSLQEIGVVIFGDPYASYDKKISRLKKEVGSLMTFEQINLLIRMD